MGEPTFELRSACSQSLFVPFLPQQAEKFGPLLVYLPGYSVLPPADLPWYYTAARPSEQSSENNLFLLGADHLGVLILNLSLLSMKAKHRV